MMEAADYISLTPQPDPASLMPGSTLAFARCNGYRVRFIQLECISFEQA